MLLVVQPWFSAVGHPAQSLINTAKNIGKCYEVIYLISVTLNSRLVSIARKELQLLGSVVDYTVKTDSVREGTLKALSSIKRLLATNFSIDRIFFLDAHLVLLATMWPFYYQKQIKRLGVVYLMGPERVARYYFVKVLIRRFLERPEVILFLRTEELVTDWQKMFSSAHIKYLPSMEMPIDDFQYLAPENNSKIIRLGILGQIRTGKSIEWLVPLFKNDPSLGKLTVAGTFNNSAQWQALAVLDDFDGFYDKFLTEDELLNQALEQDYLLMLYDKWDHRMEGAVMFLAARVNRPVIVYGMGWCGRMVTEYGNGIVFPNNQILIPELLKSLPAVNSVAYDSLLQGVKRFRQDHSGEVVRTAFLNAIKE